ncbi:MAG: hypothetical protein C4519_15230 [Desulfobacteraceae bacterium]|nr:MAG: hypothetical protein C4519_15230 [Desulfobacteraceae bacterium]
MRSIGFICFFSVYLSLAGACAAQQWAFSLYGGRVTTEGWQDALSKNANFADAGILVAAGAWTYQRFFKDALSLEVEGQVGKYFGDQKHWEFNMALVTLRWHRFPWRRFLATTFAWGIGPSYATENPDVEIAVKGGSQNWLVYWFGELTLGPPRSNWAVLLRLHHRSGAFGHIAEEGGSNTLAAGFKFYF